MTMNKNKKRESDGNRERDRKKRILTFINCILIVKYAKRLNCCKQNNKQQHIKTEIPTRSQANEHKKKQMNKNGNRTEKRKKKTKKYVNKKKCVSNCGRSDEAKSYAAIKFIYFDFVLRFYPISLILFELFAIGSFLVLDICSSLLPKLSDALWRIAFNFFFAIVILLRAK